MSVQASSSTEQAPRFDALIIGAGVCGIFALYRLRELGLKAQVLEAGPDIGGTWRMNRYPGVRFDSESVSYGYSFSKDLLADWNWSERFAGRAETERYLHHVVERFDLRRDMRFNVRVSAARWDEAARLWRVETQTGETLTCRFLHTAVGMLSTPTYPKIPGVERFEGLSFHTFDAPATPPDYAGKRVAVIGTGATGVQTISELADKVGDLTVYQRRPNWCAPLHNAPISPEEMADLKARYDEILEACNRSAGGFVHQADMRRTFDVPEAERLAFWEQLYATPGFAKWVGNFVDVSFDAKANAAYSDFIAGKIRQRVKDPAVAEKLIPKDHGFGTRRVPLETRYYEAYNRENVHLIDVNETPIVEITDKGVRTTAGETPFDIIIYATGFDAITGAFDRIAVTGVDGAVLKDKWAEIPQTTYGVMTRGFPNLITLAGPQSASVASNFPRAIEDQVNWWSGFLADLTRRGVTRVEPRAEAEAAWQSHVKATTDGLLIGTAKSWFTGYNSNLERQQGNRYLIYIGGGPRYRDALGKESAAGYPGFQTD